MSAPHPIATLAVDSGTATAALACDCGGFVSVGAADGVARDYLTHLEYHLKEFPS